MDSKSIFLSKTFWLNLLGPGFLWLGSKYGLQVDADTQAAIVTGGLALANIIMRLFTKGPVHVSGSSAAILLAILISTALVACGLTAQQIQTDITTGIQAACLDVNAAAKANPASPVLTYAQASCGSAEAMASLAQGSATLVWLGQIQQQLQQPAAPAAPAAPATKA